MRPVVRVPAMKLQLSLEWFLNPDHLPLIAGIERGWYRDAGLDLELLVPDDHYDGLAATVAGDVPVGIEIPTLLDEVRAADPQAGTSAPKGSTVTILVV